MCKKFSLIERKFVNIGLFQAILLALTQFVYQRGYCCIYEEVDVRLGSFLIFLGILDFKMQL